MEPTVRGRSLRPRYRGPRKESLTLKSIRSSRGAAALLLWGSAGEVRSTSRLSMKSSGICDLGKHRTLLCLFLHGDFADGDRQHVVNTKGQDFLICSLGLRPRWPPWRSRRRNDRCRIGIGTGGGFTICGSTSGDGLMTPPLLSSLWLRFGFSGGGSSPCVPPSAGRDRSFSGMV